MKATQILGSVGILRPLRYATPVRAKVANDTLKATMERGGRASTAAPIKKKEPPHTIDKIVKRSHSYAVVSG